MSLSSSSSKTPANALNLSLYSDWHFCSGCGLPPTTPTNGTTGNTIDKNQNQNQHNDTEILPDEAATQRQQLTIKKKLSICQRCKTAAYHNAECQKIHWKDGGHRNDCKKLAQAIQPLREIIAIFEKQQQQLLPTSNGSRRRWRWWDPLDPQDAMNGSRLWKESAMRWNHRGEYLEAMKGFQRALEPIEKLWDDQTTATTNNDSGKSGKVREEENGDCNDDPGRLSLSSLPVQDDDDNDSESTFFVDIQLAQKVLFCAYCEADGNQIRSARSRLAQCISILLEHSNYSSLSFPPLDATGDEPQKQRQNIITPLLNDAWMELMLSYEEETSAPVRMIARHVVHMAIQSGGFPGSLYRCEWNHPLQRPGYMAALETVGNASTDQQQSSSPSSLLLRPFVPSEAHPSWCKTLEAHWENIAKDLSALRTASPTPKQRWAAVGCGDRGSGGEDHRVVSAGGKWTEYVLFGTGACGNGNNDDRDAPFTKRLLRDCIPDAISLAESGGGEVIFSKLAPRTRIEAHCGPTNLRLTAHLGLVIPAREAGECKIRVEHEWHRWETGKVLLFDDSYEHEIRNDTDHIRIVLLLRLWHPLLSRDRRQNELLEARRRKERSVEKRYYPPE